MTGLIPGNTYRVPFYGIPKGWGSYGPCAGLRLSTATTTTDFVLPDSGAWSQRVFEFTATASTQTLTVYSYSGGVNSTCFTSFYLGGEVIEIIKTASSGATQAGDTVTFTMAVENQGTTELTGVSISEDTLERLDGTALTLATGPTFVSSSVGSPEGTLAQGETATYEATYELTQEDVDAGGIRNSAVAEGTDADGNLFDDISSDTPGVDENPTVVTIAAAPSYDFIKESAHDDADSNGRVDAGETIAYTFTVENTGNVSLTDVVVTDSRAVLSGSPIPGPLAPGAVDTTSVTGTYTVTQADIDAGDLDNLASATAKDPGGNDVTKQSRPPNGAEGEPTTVPGFAQIADYDFVKEARHADANGNGLFDSGETIDYTFTVENTGNVTLSDVAVTDSRATISGSPIPTLAVGQVDTTSVTGTYTITQADIDAGDLDNVADATAKDPNDDDVIRRSRPPGSNRGDPTSPPGGVTQVADYDFVKDVTQCRRRRQRADRCGRGA
nr:hypothetical protein [Nitratireductor luteus]